MWLIIVETKMKVIHYIHTRTMATIELILYKMGISLLDLTFGFILLY